MAVTGAFPIIDVALLRVDVVVETDEVRGRLEVSGLEAGLAATEGGLGSVEGDWRALPGVLLKVGVALRLTEAVVDEDDVRSLDGPASGLQVLGAFAAGIEVTSGFEVVLPFVE